ncbi:MAG TPA: outer membrane beta-barrel protein [Stellaceae bacterium]|nr:outer membrane beta-barrel protein [Stellaceae bacterium]
MRRTLTTSLALFATAAMGSTARADFGSDSSWWKSFTITGYLDAGIMGNTTGPTDGTNFGRLFDDRPNLAELNQASVVFSRPLDPNADDFDYGFTFQPMFGSDARFTHLLSVFDTTNKNSINQLTLVEADFLMHLPWTVPGGTDVKIGIFPSPLSAETTVPSNNPFYSHSYIFNFGVTVAHTGAFTVSHVSPLVDVYLGIDAGNQTTPWKDNNSSPAGWAGLGLNLLGGNLTITWLNHFGPENPTGTVNLNGQVVDGSWRSESTITTVWKYNDNLTLTTDLNFARDAGFSADAYGIAQYASYAIDNVYTLQARGEVWRDDKGFFAAAFPNQNDAINAVAGLPNGSISLFPRSATYAEITLGVNIKQHLPDPLNQVVFRPEIRYDTTTNGARPFNNGRGSDSFTIGGDLLLSF